LIQVNKNVLKMKTKSGKEIIATAKHPFFIKDINGNIKKIKLKDLKKGDKIIALENVMYFEEIKTIVYIIIKYITI